MDFIAYINSVDCAMPANIETAMALEVKRPCSVSDAYQILTNYPNLKYIKVAGEDYSRQTIGQMPIDANLGDQGVTTTARAQQAAPTPQGQTPQRQLGVWEINWDTFGTPTPLPTTTIAGTTATGIWVDEEISLDDVY